MDPEPKRKHAALDEVLAHTRHVGPEANDFLVSLMAHVPMEGSLVLSTRRDPDFFALYNLQRGSHDVVMYEDETYSGMGAILVRSGWLDGVAQPVGYLGDLRMRGIGRVRALFPAAYARFLEDTRKATGCTSFYTGILADNAIAIASLTKRREKRRDQPHYALLRKYQMASVQLLLPPRVRSVPGVRVERATPADVPSLGAFLHEDHKRRPFGYRFDDGELEHRLAHWPGFTLDDTFVARDSTGRILGCTTAWDPAPVKRYRVVRYAGPMRALALGMRVASAVLGCPPLPREGEDFRTLYLTNLSILDDDPRVLRALLFAIYPHAWQRRAHFIALPLWSDDDPHAQALAGFAVQRLPFHLYGVTSAAEARTEWPSGRPGFEIALA